jgi:hypothetical protein
VSVSVHLVLHPCPTCKDIKSFCIALATFLSPATTQILKYDNVHVIYSFCLSTFPLVHMLVYCFMLIELISPTSPYFSPPTPPFTRLYLAIMSKSDNLYWYSMSYSRGKRKRSKLAVGRRNRRKREARHITIEADIVRQVRQRTRSAFVGSGSNRGPRKRMCVLPIALLDSLSPLPPPLPLSLPSSLFFLPPLL